MATAQHSTLTGSDLHECKGAAAATSGQVPVATGSGTAVFKKLTYAELSGTPVIPTLYLNDTVATSTPITKVYSVTASGGLWSLVPTGFTTVYTAIPVAVSTGTALGTAAVATLGTYSASSVTGSVIVPASSGAALGTTQVVLVTVIGV